MCSHTKYVIYSFKLFEAVFELKDRVTYTHGGGVRKRASNCLFALPDGCGSKDRSKQRIQDSVWVVGVDVLWLSAH